MISSRVRARAVGGLAALSFLTLPTACGGGDGVSPGDNVPATFSATVTGGSAGTYSGGSLAVGSSGLFSIGLTTTDGKFALGFTRGGTRPVPGVYPLGADPVAGFSAALNVGPALYASTSGSLTITESSASSIKGSFAFVAAPAGGGAVANVSGSFAASCPSGC